MTAQRTATLTEVAPRDGLQPIGPFIPAHGALASAEAAHAAGLRRPGAFPGVRAALAASCAG